MNKYYVIFLDGYGSDYLTLYFPIKRQGFCQGMPQFFGGTQNGKENFFHTLKRELKEESDNRITIDSKSNLKMINSGESGNSILKFYICTSFKGSNFLGPLKNEEMSSIAKFGFPAGEGYDITNLFAQLQLSMSEDFASSQTRYAFDAAIKYAGA